MTTALAFWQAYEIFVNDLGGSRLADPLPIRLMFVAIALFAFILFGTLSIGGLWQLSSFARRSGIFVATGGELRKGSELHFSMRVATFKSLIEAVAIDIPKSALNERFLRVGRQAGRGFAARIGMIHDTVQTDGEVWSVLREEARIDWWTSYDRTSGWGVISVVVRANEAYVQIQHDLLFENTEGGEKSGEAVAFMMGGYCETVLNGILRNVNITIVPEQVQIGHNRATYVFKRAGSPAG